MLCGLLISCKRDKLVESSAPQRPQWAYGIERGYIISEGKAHTHDEAKNNAFTQIKESIVNAVSVNVSSTVQLDVSEKVINDVRMFKESMDIQTTVSSNFLHSLRGVQLSKAADWYWELRRTPEKERYVVYHIKYPFSEAELDNYIREWEAIDTEMAEELNSLGSRIENAATISELVLVKSEARRLADLFKEPRRTMALNAEARAAHKLDDIRLELIEHDRTSAVVALRTNGARIASADAPLFRSDCARLESIDYTKEEGLYIVRYDASACEGHTNHNFTLSVMAGDRREAITVPIPADPGSVRLMVSGPLQLYRSHGHMHQWSLPLRLLSDSEAVITEVEISMERTSGRFLASLSRKGRAGIYTNIKQPLNLHLSGKGEYSLEFEAPQYTNEADDVFRSIFESEAVYHASGKVSYRTGDEGATRSFDFSGWPVVLK